MFAAIHSALKAFEHNPIIREQQAYTQLIEIFDSIKNAKLEEDVLIKDFALISFYLLLEFLYASAAAKEYLRQANGILQV